MRSKGTVSMDAILALLVFISVLSLMLSIQNENIERIRNSGFAEASEHLERSDIDSVAESVGGGRDMGRECDSCSPSRRWFSLGGGS